jgi:hypothetical protein
MGLRESMMSARLKCWLTLLGIGSLAAVILLSHAVPTDQGNALTRNTIRVALAWYAVTICLMMCLTAPDWAAKTLRGQLARYCWTWALICFLVHVMMAFHYFHHWSHKDAFEHTRQVSGIGEGVYVSYLFAWLWIADVAAWWLWPVRYAARPVWIDRALHGFMLFVVFNSMVVFEHGVIRWAGLAMFAGLGFVWLATRATADSQPR